MGPLVADSSGPTAAGILKEEHFDHVFGTLEHPRGPHGRPLPPQQMPWDDLTTENEEGEKVPVFWPGLVAPKGGWATGFGIDRHLIQGMTDAIIDHVPAERIREEVKENHPTVTDGQLDVFFEAVKQCRGVVVRANNVKDGETNHQERTDLMD